MRTSSLSPTKRFGFGANWARYVKRLTPERIRVAEASLLDMLGPNGISGLSFLDIGSGSGLFSLAAMNLGAGTVHSLDYDPDSVACGKMLRDRYHPGAANWTIERGDATDEAYMGSLGRADIVYSWGVLHHTGEMWKALDLAGRAVADSGSLFIAIYNDEGLASRYWRMVKRVYNFLPAGLKIPYALTVMTPIELRAMLGFALRGNPVGYMRSWTHYAGVRGMSRWHDLLDWVGGYPFEVATPTEIFDFYKARGFQLDRLETAQGLGCNQFVFTRR